MKTRAHLSRVVVAFGVVLLSMGANILLQSTASASGGGVGSIIQTSPTTAVVDVAGSATYASNLEVSGADPSTLTYSAAGPSSPPGLTVDASGTISTTGSTLAANTYTIAGSDSDGDGDSGNWTFALTVNPDPINQTSPTTDAVDVAGSASYTTNLEVSDPDPNTLVFLAGPSSPPGLTVDDATGAIVTTGDLAANTYTIAGSDSDGDGDSGNWTFALTVNPDPINQTSPTTATTTSAASASFVPGSIGVSINVATVSFVTLSSSLALNVSTSGVISTTGALSAGSYTVAGTDSDTLGDTGTWTYTLTVTQTSGGGAGGSTLTQTSPTSGATTTTNSKAFAPGTITVANNVGKVTFVTVTSSAGLSVSASGVISTTGTLVAGTYKVAGSDSDTLGDYGTWTYTLTVTNITATVTYKANGGSGSMAPETQAQPSSLTINSFTRAGYTFVDWNTAAKGSGTSYTNGATYPFTSSTTLYAQWKKGKVKSHTVKFEDNGGRGASLVETHNTATSLTKNSFTRSGYTFVDWNTKANGSGTSFANGATYRFTSSTTLYAQWKKVHTKPTFSVHFAPNGARGSMSVEHGRRPQALSPVTFTRTGYTFVDWNTAANGSGTSYTNGATYRFTSSTTLYAQWKKKAKKKAKIPSPVHATATIKYFATGSSKLTPSLEAQINALVTETVADHDRRIALVGYGDKLSAADQLNEADWAANYTLSQKRSEAVKTYLVARLRKIRYSTFLVNATGSGSAVPSSGSSPKTYRLVVATLK